LGLRATGSAAWWGVGGATAGGWRGPDAAACASCTPDVDVTVMEKPIQKRGRHDFIAKDLAPLSGALVAGRYRRRVCVAPARWGAGSARSRASPWPRSFLWLPWATDARGPRARIARHRSLVAAPCTSRTRSASVGGSPVTGVYPGDPGRRARQILPPAHGSCDGLGTPGYPGWLRRGRWPVMR
jgi:hypothetical protein